MRTDKEKNELRELQSDTAKAILKFLEGKMRNFTAEQMVGYMQCLHNLEFSEVREIDVYRSYKTTESYYEIAKEA